MKFLKKHILIIGVLALLTLPWILFFYNKSQQSKNWQFLIEDRVGAKSILNIGKNPTFDGDSIYLSDGAGKIYSIDANNGSVNWELKLEDHSPFQISLDHEALYVSSFDSHIYKIDKKNGYIIWSYAIPNFFWPDTELVFDENDKSIYFADRGGFLYALDKQNGQLVWRKEFGTIDNSKSFVEGSIHFGFLKQTEEQILADHFPSKTIYTVNKETGEVEKEEESGLEIKINKPSLFFDFKKHQLHVEQNVISQPTFHLTDYEQNLIWTYKLKHKINAGEMYQHKNRIYYLDSNNQLLSSILIGEQNPEEANFEKINFQIKEDFSTIEPYKGNPNPQINYEENKKGWKEIASKKIRQSIYILQNFKQLFEVTLNLNEKVNYLELTINHQDNFYDNKFTKVRIEADFYNPNTKEKISSKGFYDDKNTWKVRAKLKQGDWEYKVKFSAGLIRKTLTGQITIKNNPEPSLQVEGDKIILGENIFFPLGFQDTILDISRDGNPLNKLGFAKNAEPPQNASEYSYLDLEKYFSLYKEEAGFNIFRFGPDNWAPSIWKNLANQKEFAMQINGNKQGDFILETARKNGFKVMMSIFSFHPPYISKEAMDKQENKEILEMYLDYVIARYSAQIDIWELANEAIPSREWQDFVSDYLRENDPYKHPITISLEDTELKNSDLLSIHLYSEPPDNNLELLNEVALINNRYDRSEAKIISEFGFAKSNHFPDSAEALRKFAWIFNMQKIGFISWNTGYGLYLNHTNGNVYLGPKERAYLKILSEFIPSMSKNTISNNKLENNNQLAVYELKDEKTHLLYLLNLSENQSSFFELPLEISRNGTIEFINPQNGNKLMVGSVKDGQSNLFLPIFSDDLAIKIIYN